MIRIVQGGKAEFSIYLLDEDGRPYDLTNFDKYKVCIPLGSGAGFQVTESANGNGSVVTQPGDAKLGELKVEINGADTAELTPESRLPLDIELDNAASPDPIRERFDDAIQVIESTCS